MSALHPAINAAIAATLAADGLMVGASDCEPCQPFGGRYPEADSDDEPRPAAASGTIIQAAGVSVGDDMGSILSIIQRIGGQPCKIWGELPPGSCYDPGSECFSRTGMRKMCGTILPYDVPITEGSQEFELKPSRWFLPLGWVDTSSADVIVRDVKFNDDGVFGGSGNIYPATQFPPNGKNYLPGLPGISKTSGLQFTLDDASGANDGTVVFRGFFLGLAIR